MGREAAKISALSSKDLEDLGHKPSLFENLNMSILHWACHLVKHQKKIRVKSGAKSKSDFNYDKKHAFYRFCKGFNEFKEMSLDSKHNRMKEFTKLHISFKAVKTKKERETLLIKEQIMENVDELYEKYYNSYKSEYDTDDELNGAKKKEFELKIRLQTV